MTRFGAALLLALALGGCVAPRYQGREPPVAALSGLAIGAATRAEIRAALGEPTGHGGFAEAGAPAREIWVYAANESDHGDIHSKELLVFIDQDSGRLAGYWWYRGGVLIGRAP